jgi:1,2-phenylacetyl-CoA epoxidase catalytic subunit
MTQPELLESPAETPQRVYEAGDPDLPEELRGLLIRMLSNHLENSANPYYMDLVADLWRKGMELAPDEGTKVAYARVMAQEVEHGALTARILESLGAPPVNQPIKQYFFQVPIDTFCDMAYFNGLGDRVGIYIGETWAQVPYAPLRNAAPKLHKDELFHTTFGMKNLRTVCSTPEGLAEANEKIKKWWPAALDTFGRSDSTFSQEYVRWGIRNEDNEALRRRYSADTRPLIEELGISVPDDLDNRRYL